MAGIVQGDDLLLINRGGVDYQASKAEVFPGVCDLEELPGELTASKPWDKYPVLLHVIVVSDRPKGVLVGERDYELTEYSFKIFNKNTEEELDLRPGIGRPYDDGEPLFVELTEEEKNRIQLAKKDKKKNHGKEGYVPPRVNLRAGEWIIASEVHALPDDFDGMGGEDDEGKGFTIGETDIDFQLGPLTKTAAMQNFCYLFSYCYEFNNLGAPLPTGFKTDNALSLQGMFMGCFRFNAPVNHLKVSNVKTITYCFEECELFDQPLNQWDLSNCVDTSSAFSSCASFNGDVTNWNVSQSKDISFMFAFCTAFNQDISGWNTSAVGDEWDMNNMFANAKAFNQDLSGWCVSPIRSEPRDFSKGADSWTKPKPVWGTCPRGEDGKP